MKKEWRTRISALLGSALSVTFAGLAWADEARQPLYAGEQPAPPPKTWVDEVKHPVDWFTWGADLRIREKWMDNHITLNDDVPGHNWHFERVRSRLWGTVSPCKEFDFNARLTWEFRHWWEGDRKVNMTPAGPKEVEEWDWSDVIPDTFNGRLKLADWNTNITVGRQDIILGDGWLVLDGTPLDGSRTIFFDAARGTVGLKECKTTIDVIGISQFSSPDEWLGPINSQHVPLIEQDENGGILYVTNKSIKDVQIDGYFIYKHDEAVLPNGDQGDIYTIGGRADWAINQNWRLKGEGAYQFGNRENPAMFSSGSHDVSAWGTTEKLIYSFNDNLKQQIKLGTEFLSGDDPDSKTVEQFDSLWGRWPQWSELYIYSFAQETRIAEVTNLARFNVGYECQPMTNMGIFLDYHALWALENSRADQSGFSHDGKFRGHLFTALLKYKFNKYVSGHLLAEHFIPGNYYDEDEKGDAATFLRAELFFTF